MRLLLIMAIALVPCWISFADDYSFEIPEDEDAPNVEASIVFEEMGVAMQNGLTPRQWYLEPIWSRATMVAFSRQSRRLAYWTEWWRKNPPIPTVV